MSRNILSIILIFTLVICVSWSLAVHEQGQEKIRVGGIDNAVDPRDNKDNSYSGSHPCTNSGQAHRRSDEKDMHVDSGCIPFSGTATDSSTGSGYSGRDIHFNQDAHTTGRRVL